jgi:chromosome segregation ATPase
MIPPYGAYTPQPPDGHYMHRSYSVSDQPYAASFQAIQNLGLNNGQVNENGTISPPENDQEHIELLQRIQSAIPDINRLLHGFRHTHTRLSSREAEMKQIGNQHEQALMHKDFYIEALQSQMKKTASESAEECAKLRNTINELRLELGDLQEKQKDLEDGLAGHQKSNEELSQSKSELEAEIEKLNASIKEAQETHQKELETQKEDHAKALTTQKQELTELFEEIKNEDEKAAAETLEAREKDLRDQHESAKEEWAKEKKLMEDTLETQRGELDATKSELASKIATLETKESELETRLAELNTTREEVATKVAELEAKEKELEETRQKNAQELEAIRQGHAGEQDTLRSGHAGELDTLRQAHSEQLAAAAKDLNEKIAAIEANFLEQEKHWEAERAALQKLLTEKDEELNSAEREKDKLEGDGLIKEQQLQRAVEEMKSTIDHLDHDCDRLRRTLMSLGEATDLKTTKGDQFL